MRNLGRGTLASTLIALAGLAVAGCGSDDDEGGGAAKKGGEITIAQTSQPDYLDPALSYTVNGWEPMWLVYTPPVTYKHAEGTEGAQLVPGIAEELPKVSNGGKTYAFTIRKGLKYSNGEPVKASDFEHTVKRVINLESGGSFYYEDIVGAAEYQKAGKPEGDISGIEADDRTGEVTIELTAASGSFVNVLALNFSGIVPGDTPFKNLTKDPPPGVGSYAITRSVPNREFVMERNENFDVPGIPKGKVEKITTKIVKSAERQTQDVISGKLDFMQDPPPADLLPDVRTKYKDRYEEHETVSTYYFFMNQRVKPFDKKEVRQAVNYAIDSRDLGRLFGGRLTPGCNFIPSQVPGYEKIDPCPYGDPEGPGDLAKARQLVDEAGERGTEVTVYTNNDENRPEIGQYYTDLLNKIGLNAELKTVDAGVYFQTIGNQRERTATGFTNWYADFQHPRNYMFLVNGEAIQPTNNENYSNVDDPKLNKLIETVEAGPATDPKVQEAAAEADRLIVENAYEAPYGTERVSTFLSERMDFENCSLFHPLYQNDYSSFCLK
jgi:peptide/nickel transport system substrate-binding protein